MRVTTQQMRKSVAGWLAEENATIVQALMLQAAIYAGAIAGDTYIGKRTFDHDLIEVVDNFQSETDEKPSGDYVSEDIDTCGCLLDTFERIKDARPLGEIVGASKEAFSLALMIGLGDTPSNSRWARAAVKGIEDYVASLEAAA